MLADAPPLSLDGPLSTSRPQSTPPLRSRIHGITSSMAVSSSSSMPHPRPSGGAAPGRARRERSSTQENALAPLLMLTMRLRTREARRVARRRRGSASRVGMREATAGGEEMVQGGVEEAVEAGRARVHGRGPVLRSPWQNARMSRLFPVKGRRLYSSPVSLHDTVRSCDPDSAV